MYTFFEKSYHFFRKTYHFFRKTDFVISSLLFHTRLFYRTHAAPKRYFRTEGHKWAENILFIGGVDGGPPAGPAHKSEHYFRKTPHFSKSIPLFSKSILLFSKSIPLFSKSIPLFSKNILLFSKSIPLFSKKQLTCAAQKLAAPALRRPLRRLERLDQLEAPLRPSFSSVLGGGNGVPVLGGGDGAPALRMGGTWTGG